jgi:hypothetical protein
MSAEFHIFVSDRTSSTELEIPGEERRIEFCSLFAAARHVRKHPSGRNSTIVIHDPNSKSVNRIPVYGDL